MSLAADSHSPTLSLSEERFYIQTYTDRKFFFDDIAGHDFSIVDIAHALSLNARWTGHTKFFYPVGMHCIKASYEAPPRHALGALLHDANEAYLHDMPSPLKWWLASQGFDVFVKMEHEIDEAIFRFFGVPYPMAPEIKEVDRRLLSTEKRDLMPGKPYSDSLAPYDWHCPMCRPQDVERMYLERFYLLKDGFSR